METREFNRIQEYFNKEYGTEDTLYSITFDRDEGGVVQGIFVMGNMSPCPVHLLWGSLPAGVVADIIESRLLDSMIKMPSGLTMTSSEAAVVFRAEARKQVAGKQGLRGELAPVEETATVTHTTFEPWIYYLLPIMQEYGEGEALDGDAVDDLTVILRAKMNLYHGNITEEEYEEACDRKDIFNERA